MVNVSRPVTSQPEGHNKSIDTGKAALLAYTNLDPPGVEELVGTDWRKGQNTRNIGVATTSGAGEPQNNRELHQNLKVQVAQTAVSDALSQ